MKKALVVLAILGAIVAVAVWSGTEVPDEVQPIAWSAEPCAHCHMLIGEPAYAAQIITEDGRVLSFDDPGCAARYIAERRPKIHRAWFHAGHGDAWIPIGEVAFLRAGSSPMGTNVIAVKRGTPNAIALEELR